MKKIHWVGKMRIIRMKKKSKKGFRGEWELRTQTQWKKEIAFRYVCTQDRVQIREEWSTNAKSQMWVTGCVALPQGTNDHYSGSQNLTSYWWPILWILFRGVGDNSCSVINVPIRPSSLFWFNVCQLHLFRKLHLLSSSLWPALMKQVETECVLVRVL